MLDFVTSLDQLEALYGEVNTASRVKETDRLTPEYRAFIEGAPFAALATMGPEGLDCSPRGDEPASSAWGRAHADAAGPARQQPHRFLAQCARRSAGRASVPHPGVGETLRVNGRARISVAPDLLASFEVRASSRDPCS
jgi:predicted pyridoxine 5'-phosphate oxidase superfamily flavin-nucleotide-binding protein